MRRRSHSPLHHGTRSHRPFSATPATPKLTIHCLRLFVGHSCSSFIPILAPHWSFVLRHSSFAISAAWLVVPCVACDFLMVPVFSALRGGGPPGEFIAALAFGIVGCVFSQGALLA